MASLGDEELTTIDLRVWRAVGTDTASRAEMVDKVRRACEHTGFLAVTGFQRFVPRATVEAAAGASRAFFQRPLAEKMQCAAGDRAYGYFPLQSEALGYSADVAKRPDLREAFSMGPAEAPPARLSGASGEQRSWQEVVDFCFQPTPWPEAAAPAEGAAGGGGAEGLPAAMEALFAGMSSLGRVVLGILALALDLPEDHFAAAAADGSHCNSARAIWYPRLEAAAAEGQARCGAHSDTGALTLLWSDGPGLEVLPRSSAEWRRVSAPPGSLVVNIGELLERVSNGRWKSTPHRVPAPAVDDAAHNNDRLVLVLFVILCPDFVMAPVAADGEALYEPVTQGEYLFSHFKRWGRNAKDPPGDAGAAEGSEQRPDAAAPLEQRQRGAKKRKSPA